MEVTRFFEKWNNEEPIVYARECGCPYRFKPTDITPRSVRDRSRGRGRSASLTRGTAVTLQSPRTTSHSVDRTGRTNRSKMEKNGTVSPVEVPQTKYSAPKRYETTCYFMPLAVPVWYSTSVSIKINSTKRQYKESVNYQKKLVPYRFVETMTTETKNTPPVLYVSEVNIDNQVPEGDHYISLENQQQAALDKPFSTNHHIQVESHS